VFPYIISYMSKTYFIFSSHYLPNIGGIEKYTQNLADALLEMGNRVIVATMNTFDLPQNELLEQNLEIIRLPCYKTLGGRYPVPRRNKAYRAELDRIRHLAVDYVVVNARFYLLSYIGVKLAKQKGIVPIIIDHSSSHLTMGNSLIDFFVYSSEHLLTNNIKRFPAHYYAVSKASVEWLHHFNIQAHGVLNNAIDAKEFRASSSNRDFRNELGLGEESFIVCFVGRFIPEKGIKQLIESAKLLAGFPDIQFLFAGSGSLEGYLHKQHLPNVHILGRLDSSDIAALFLSANVNCLPSRSEGFATTLLEAAACGLVSVSTKIGGAEELIPTDEHGVFLDSQNNQEIADAILMLYNNPTKRRIIGENARLHVEKMFSWEKTAQALEIACEKANNHEQAAR